MSVRRRTWSRLLPHWEHEHGLPMTPLCSFSLPEYPQSAMDACRSEKLNNSVQSLLVFPPCPSTFESFNRWEWNEIERIRMQVRQQTPF
jgi:hypothetical protein